ncbi:MAG: hypothetical protein ACXADH_06080 [Candidatus Kariarchaeaceae archaeon]|jgi:hypothetical protein
MAGFLIIIFLFAVFAAVYLLLRIYISGEIQKGDSSFKEEDFNATKKSYSRGMKLSWIMNRRFQSMLYLRQAFLGLALNQSIDDITIDFDNALSKSQDTDFHDVEAIVGKLDLVLTEDIYKKFHGAEIRLLNKLLREQGALPKYSGAIKIRQVGGKIDASYRSHPDIDSHVTADIGDSQDSCNVLRIRLIIGTLRLPTFSSRERPQGPKSVLTSSLILEFLNNSPELKSKISFEIVKDMTHLIFIVLTFLKGRPLLRRIDQIVIDELKTIPVAWYGGDVESSFAETITSTYRYKISYIKTNLSTTTQSDTASIVDFVDRQNLFRLSPNGAAYTMNEFWQIDEDGVQFSMG